MQVNSRIVYVSETETNNILSIVYISPTPGAEHVWKYQSWKWKTNHLVSELLEAGTIPNAAQHRTQLERHFAQAISEVITPFMRSSPDGHGDALASIIHEAIELDKAASKTIPRYTWAFSPGPIESSFDFSLEQDGVMKLHPGEKTAEKLARGTRTKVYLVVTPGVMQRGGMDGELSSFEVERWVSPMEVTCVRTKRQRKFALTESGSDSPSNSPLPP